MTRWCVVPKCTTGSRADGSKRSVFRVPKDPNMLKKWESAIPGNIKLKPANVVCDRHFEERYILRAWIKHDMNGKIIAQAPYKHPQLDKSGVPSKFGGTPPLAESMERVPEIVQDIAPNVQDCAPNTRSNDNINLCEESAAPLSIEDEITKSIKSFCYRALAYRFSLIFSNDLRIPSLIEPDLIIVTKL